MPNSEQIKSVNNQGAFDSNNPNIYYQNKPAYEYDYIHHQITGENIKLELNPELEKRKDEIVKPINISKTKINFKSGKKVDVQNAIKQKMFAYKNGKPVPIQAINKNTNVNAIINASTVEESIKELLNNADKDFVASILLNSKEIFENSEYIFSNEDAKKSRTDDNKQKIHRYANVINYENENYIVISTLKDNSKNKNKPKNQPEIKIYHITGYKNSGIKMRNQNTSNFNTTNISISDLINFVKSRVVENYNNDYKSSQNKTLFQSAQNFDINSGIENNFGDSVENITEGIRADIQNILDENNISADEFKINDIRIYGSYATEQNKNTSDIDFLVEYSGTMREDDAFNIFSDAELKLTDINGKEVNVDINPIRKDKSRTIDEFLERNKDYRKNYIRTFFQSAYHGTLHRFDKFTSEVRRI